MVHVHAGSLMVGGDDLAGRVAGHVGRSRTVGNDVQCQVQEERYDKLDR